MLKFNEKTQAFVLYTDDTKTAEAAGLTLSTSVRGPKGERVYFTADQKRKPVFNPYAALEFYDEADAEARDRLQPLADDYARSWADEDEREFPCPRGKAYLPYQQAGIAYALDRTHCIIGDEPGLGKTIQAIGIANALGARKILVVCPASIRLNWCREIGEWSTFDREVMKVPILTGKDVDKINNADYVVISYDLLRNTAIHKALRAIEWDLAIFDEAHYLKSVNAKRTRAVFGGGARPVADVDGAIPYSFYENGLEKNIKRMVAMTGTPLPNRPRECYTLARGLDWASIDYLSEEAFLFRYNPSMEVSSGHNLEAKGRLPELNARLRCNIMVRRLKKDVLPQLPDKRYEMTYVETDGSIRNVLAKEALIDFNPDDLFSSDFSMDGTPISTLRREMGEAMVDRVVEYVKYMMDVVEHPKIILYAHHKAVISALMMELANYNPVLHTGGMKTENKEESKRIFMEDTHARIFIGQLDTMEGVDGLQSVCSDVVFAEPAWTPGRNEQCVDRTHRIGQHDNVVAHFLLVEGSFNEKVLNVVLSKAGDIHTVIDKKVVG